MELSGDAVADELALAHQDSMNQGDNRSRYAGMATGR